MSQLQDLWTEKYRPKTIDDYVFTSRKQHEQVTMWVKDQSIPSLLLTGCQGAGKTSLAKLLIRLLNVDRCDVLEINASRENSVEDVRNKIVNFVSTMPFGAMKIVLLDEVDYASIQFQAALRGVMESNCSTVRFILTCNYANKILPALHSRCQSFQFDKLDMTEFTTRAATILVNENVEFDLDTLDSFVKATYPDLRKCINLLQQNSNTGTLLSHSSDASVTSDYKLDMVNLFKKGKYKEARQLVCSQARPEDMDDFFRWAYTNLSLWGDTDTQQDDAILIIRTALINHSLVADAEINLAAMLIELSQLRKS